MYALWVPDWDDGKARMCMGQVGDLFDVSGWVGLVLFIRAEETR